MQACRQVYDLARAANITPILGVEGYLRDDSCPILLAGGVQQVDGTLESYAKYFHFTAHALDQQAYEALVKVLSRACLTRMEHHGSEDKPLFTWRDLEELGQYNITMTSGCLAGVVQRHLTKDRPDLALKYYQRVKSILKPGNFYVEVFPHKTTHQWVAGIYLTLSDGSKRKFWTGKKFKTNAIDEIKAEDLAKRPKGHTKLLALKNNRVWEEIPDGGLDIVSVEQVEDYLINECTPFCPDSDTQRSCNKFMLALATRFKDPILVSDDAHFATEDEKIVQDCRLCATGGNWRFFGSYHRQTSAEAFAHFQQTLGVQEQQFAQWVENSRQWGARFKEFKLEYPVSLPTKFYPPDTLAHTKVLIDRHGRMDWNNRAMVGRLSDEIDLLHRNGKLDLLPYFQVGEDVCSFYGSKGILTGPGRGSAAGLLLAYLLGITHLNPLDHGLSRERFLTLDRIQSGKLPDIDQDLPDREPLDNLETGFLKTRFGDHAVQISTDTLLRLKSSIKDVARARHGGKVPVDIEVLTKKLPVPPQGVTDHDFVFGYKGEDGTVHKGLLEVSKDLQDYTKRYSADWAVVQKMLGIARQKGRHACLPGGEVISTSEGPREITRCDGMMVVTGQGATATATLLPQGVREVTEYRLETGKIIQATPDHQVLTDRGWMAIQEAYESGADLLDPGSTGSEEKPKPTP